LNVVITGATGGLGKELVSLLLEEKYKVAAIDRSKENLSSIGSDDNLFIFQADLKSPQLVENVLENIDKKFGNIDILINAMGGFAGGESVLEMEIGEWQKLIDLNLHATFYVSRKAMQVMAVQKSGKIINISAMASFVPQEKKLAYFFQNWPSML
jgi:short-subunit dehydrogenase